MKKIFLLIALYSLQANAQWQPLFDGKTLNGWKKVAGTGEYEVRDGAIVGISVPNSPNTFLVSEKEYSDFILELDMKVEDTTSNTGVQFRSHFDPQANNGKGRVYGYQFEVDPTSRRWTGGIYDEARREWLYPLTLNPGVQDAFLLNEYNKIRIEAIGHTLRTFINGKEAAFLIDTVDASGFIALQVHGIGNPAHAGRKVYWKNIRIKTAKLKPSHSKGTYIVNMIPNYISPWEKKNGLTLLFDGKTSNGWTGAHKDHFPEKGWQIENGELRVLASNGGESTNGGDIVTNETFSAFDLSFDFKLTKGANSGVKYFVTLNEKNSGSAIGLEYQLLDDSLHPDAKMGREGNRTLASLYDLIKAQKTTRFIRQPGEWNRGRIVVYPDNRVEHYLNGIKVLEYQRGSQAYRDLVAISKYKVWENFGEAAAGRILLQDHGDAVSFRSVKIRKM
ncbi:MAG: hypothetical protein B7Z54_07130 [Sphingobacteriales bacterium 12-47-4]|nr:MAG: hypothetical protein B7Z54_07130 [Sphingobacteriales bacterium 12-47-4]